MLSKQTLYVLPLVVKNLLKNRKLNTQFEPTPFILNSEGTNTYGTDYIQVLSQKFMKAEQQLCIPISFSFNHFRFHNFYSTSIVLILILLFL